MSEEALLRSRGQVKNSEEQNLVPMCNVTLNSNVGNEPYIIDCNLLKFHDNNSTLCNRPYKRRLTHG